MQTAPSADGSPRRSRGPRLEYLDKAAQIQISDEIFGDTGCEQFAQLLGQGQGAWQATIDRAHEADAVLDVELIAKAAKIDRKFIALSIATGSWEMSVIVAATVGVVALSDFENYLDASFGNEAAERQTLGDGLYDSIEAMTLLPRPHAPPCRR